MNTGSIDTEVARTLMVRDEEARTLNGTVREGPGVWTIVLAAGEGTRLRPLTRALHGEELPKQFAVIQGERSLVQTTVARVAGWSPEDQTVVVVAKDREALARRQLEAYGKVDIVAQPSNLGTGPGLLLPLARVMEQDPKAVVVVVPSDHYVQNDEPFVESIERAATIAREKDCVVLVGAVPDRAETEYGWILPSREAEDEISRFQEKPKRTVAEELLATGALWNTFIIVAPGERLWALGKEHLPTQTALLETYGHAIGSPNEREILECLYEAIEPADFSQAVLERARGLRVVPLSPCGWSDWGTPERVLESLRGSADFDALIARLGARGEAHRAHLFLGSDAPPQGHQAA